MAFTEHARDAKVTQTGSCFRRGFNQAGSRTNFSLCPLIVHIQVHGSWGAEMRPFSAEDRDTQGHLSSREEIGRERYAGPTERKQQEGPRKSTCKCMETGKWPRQFGSDSSPVSPLLPSSSSLSHLPPRSFTSSQESIPRGPWPVQTLSRPSRSLSGTSRSHSSPVHTSA